jgi:hypothetical protein
MLIRYNYLFLLFDYLPYKEKERITALFMNSIQSQPTEWWWWFVDPL